MVFCAEARHALELVAFSDAYAIQNHELIRRCKQRVVWGLTGGKLNREAQRLLRGLELGEVSARRVDLFTTASV